MADVIARGIDISSHQGDIDFAKVKAAGYSYVIIRAGQGLREMQTFKGRYLPAVLAAGLDWGAYWWSDAVTVSYTHLDVYKRQPCGCGTAARADSRI